MGQSVWYLYECDQEKKLRNAGFVKVRGQGDKQEISIYGMNLEENLEPFILHKTEGRMRMTSCAFREENRVIDGKCADGILLKKSDGKMYLATGDDAFPILEEEEDCIVEPYIPPKSLKCEKILRQDLSRLPRREWRLANNHFLLHGFYNYHHLLYITEEEEVWIGVPGIYHEKEAEVAAAFGFPKFRRIIEQEIELAPDETNLTEDFGYWCRRIDKAEERGIK